MKIGVDATALVAQATGVGNYIRPILAAMCQSHPEASFLLYSNDEVAGPAARNATARVSHPKRRGPWWQNTSLVAMLRADRPDVFWAANGLMPVRPPPGMGVVATVHDLVYRFARQTLPWHSRVGRALSQPYTVRHADRLVAVSQATADDVQRINGRCVDAVIHPVPDPSFGLGARADAARVRAKLALVGPYLLTTGTLEPRKNLVALLGAYVRCRTRGVPLPLLVIAGRKGWRDAAIERLVSEAETRGHVRWLGFVDAADLPGLYSGADAFLMPSRYEGFGMPLLEAQMCGVPVLHGAHSSMVEAAGGLGTELHSDERGLRADLTAYARGELTLTCRLPSSVEKDAAAAAATMWSLLERARRSPHGSVG